MADGKSTGMFNKQEFLGEKVELGTTWGMLKEGGTGNDCSFRWPSKFNVVAGAKRVKRYWI
jgi:hypothetical protein